MLELLDKLRVDMGEVVDGFSKELGEEIGKVMAGGDKVGKVGIWVDKGSIVVYKGNSGVVISSGSINMKVVSGECKFRPGLAGKAISHAERLWGIKEMYVSDTVWVDM